MPSILEREHSSSIVTRMQRAMETEIVVQALRGRSHDRRLTIGRAVVIRNFFNPMHLSSFLEGSLSNLQPVMHTVFADLRYRIGANDGNTLTYYASSSLLLVSKPKVYTRPVNGPGAPFQGTVQVVEALNEARLYGNTVTVIEVPFRSAFDEPKITPVVDKVALKLASFAFARRSELESV